jgi:uncharacterized protein (DUF433 family)
MEAGTEIAAASSAAVSATAGIDLRQDMTILLCLGSFQPAWSSLPPSSSQPKRSRALRATSGLGALLGGNCSRQAQGLDRVRVPPARQGAEWLATLVVARYPDVMTFTRITIDPAVCTGKPCIRGLRFPVARLLGLMAAGESRDAILKAYPYLEPGDIDEALRYAAFLAEDETVEL